MSEDLGFAMKLSALKGIFKFLTPVNCFLEEFWLYAYHQTSYPELFQAFIVEIDLMNYLKLSPPFPMKFPDAYSNWAET